MLGSLRLFLSSIQDGGENSRSERQREEAYEASKKSKKTLHLVWSPGSSRVLLNRRGIVARSDVTDESFGQSVSESAFPLAAFSRILSLLSDQWIEAFPEDMASKSFDFLKPRFQTLQLVAVRRTPQS